MDVMPSAKETSSLREQILQLLAFRDTLLDDAHPQDPRQLLLVQRKITRLFALARKRGEVCGCHEECTDEAWGPKAKRA